MNEVFEKALKRIQDRPVGFTDWIFEEPDFPLQEIVGPKDEETYKKDIGNSLMKTGVVRITSEMLSDIFAIHCFPGFKPLFKEPVSKSLISDILERYHLYGIEADSYGRYLFFFKSEEFDEDGAEYIIVIQKITEIDPIYGHYLRFEFKFVKVDR